MFFLSGYRVEKFDTKKGRWEKVADVTGQKCVVPKLTEGNEYKFRVIAENKNGESEPLETEKPITAKKPFGKNFFYLFSVIGAYFIHILNSGKIFTFCFANSQNFLN